MKEKGRAIRTFFEHLNFNGFGDEPMSFVFSGERLTDEDRETAKHIRVDTRTGILFDDREEPWRLKI